MTSPELPRRVEVAIVGAGTAGAAAAAFCAERGTSVLCVDRRPLAKAGAHWANGIPSWAFREAGIALPSGKEARGGGGPYHLVAGYGPVRSLIPDHDMLEVDMRELVARLQGMARANGAVLAGEVQVREYADGVLHTDRGDVESEWIVDASGMHGAALLQQPRVDPRDICVAAQQVRRVSDPGAARAYFSGWGVQLGQVIGFTCVAGGFSILNLRSNGDEVNILAGSIPAEGHPPGTAMVEEFVAEHSWVGETVFGGSGAIPLRRPFDRIAAGRVAAIGDAAAQVFPAHGSGVGAGMIAARTLADALADGRGAEGYAVDWQRRYGGLLAAFDVFRRFSQTLTVADMESIIGGGLSTPELARQAMEQRLPKAELWSMPRIALAAMRQPRNAARLTKVAARMLAARALYARYPRDSDHLPRWSRMVARALGDTPDLP